jgi:hypothetical protein
MGFVEKKIFRILAGTIGHVVQPEWPFNAQDFAKLEQICV